MATTTQIREPEDRQNGLWLWGAALLCAASLAIRIRWYPVITTDYTYFVRVWFETLAAHPGLTAFLSPFADYAPLYLYLLKLLTFLPLSSLVSVKTLSLLADFAIAFSGYRILRAWAGQKRALLGAAALFALPTVMLNTSLWGQSDSLYAAPTLASFWFLLINWPLAAALFFGIAVSIKVQAVFFAPVLIGYLLRRRETRRYLALPPLVFGAFLVPAWVGGGDLSYWGTIYAHQAGEYPYLSVSAQSIFAFVQPYALSASVASGLFWAGIVLAGLAGAAITFLAWRARHADAPNVALLALASALFIPYLLPRMHERYFYLADLFAVLYALMLPRRALVPSIVVFSSLLSYMPFLSGQVGFLSAFDIDLRLPATLLLIPLIIIGADLVRAYRGRRFGLVG